MTTKFCEKCKKPFVYKKRKFRLCRKCRKNSEKWRYKKFKVHFICFINGSYLSHYEWVKALDVFDAAKVGWTKFNISKPHADYTMWSIKKVNYVQSN